MILGIDEVGRGPWAGPLVVGAVVLGGVAIDGLTDSKALTKKRREALDVLVREQAEAWALGWVSAAEIDEIGLSAALKLATRRAVEQITVPYHEIIIDGTVNFLADTAKGAYVTTMKKADLLVPSVSAASIVAKVARDTYMTEQDAVYPGYGFGTHVGYGTAAHRAAIERLGVTSLHRLSYAPLAKYRDELGAALPERKQGTIRRVATRVASLSSAKLLAVRQSSTRQEAPQASAGSRTSVSLSGNAAPPSSKQVGDTAEAEVENYLVRHGHEILERNWKTKYCEIDIVSQKGGVVYFTEVKYRKQSRQGGGVAAITPKKLNQMKFAAKFYAHVNNISDTNLRLAVAAVVGRDFVIETWLKVD